MIARILLSSLISVVLLAQFVHGQAGKPKWVDAQDLMIRSGGEKNFTKTTPRQGVEFYVDTKLNTLIAINEAGAIAVTPIEAMTTDRKAEWSFAHDLRARKADDEAWKSAKPFGVEAFTYKTAKQIIYASEAKGLTFLPLPAQVGSDTPPAWHHGLLLKVRSPGMEKFADAKTKIGIEAFKDGNTGGLIYITETGQLATTTSTNTTPDPSSPKRPTPIYGLEPQVRKAEERDFTKSTKVLSVEVFVDANSNSLLYVSEAGFIAAIPDLKNNKEGQGLAWSHAMSLKARKGGEKEFTNATKYGVEVFTDKNSGCVLYVSETGSIAVFRPKPAK